MKVQRLDPKPRKYARLWQAYLWWNELVKTRQRHNLRIFAIESGRSNLDSQFEKDMISDMDLDAMVDDLRKTMINYGEEVPAWEWVTNIKGLKSGSLAAQLLAQIDDIQKFATVSKLWRFSGYAVFDGKAEHGKIGEKSHYNRKLKSICYLIAEQFIRQQTPGYVDIYYEEKARQRELHPEIIKDENGKKRFTDAHIHKRAWRKMVKVFLQDLWVAWRAIEGS
jgi:hypothetical protein